MSSLTHGRSPTLYEQRPLFKNWVPLFSSALFVGLILFVWLVTMRTVYVTVDGSAEQVRTHRRRVGLLLRDIGLSLRDADLVSVAANQSLRSGMRIEVQRAPLYRLWVDKRELTVASWGRTPADVLRDAGFTVGLHDRVAVNGRFMTPVEPHAPPDTTTLNRRYALGYPWAQTKRGLLQMRVHRAIPISVSDGGLTFTIRTTQQTVGEALREAKITIFRGDTVEPKLGTPVSTGLRIYIVRSVPVSISVDGLYVKTRTQSKTVADALTEMGVGLAGLDEVAPPLATELYDNIEIRISRIREDIAVKEDIAPFETVYVPDSNLLIDTQQVVNPGAEGITRQRTRVLYRDQEEVSRVLEDTWIAQEPAQRVIAYGQKIVPNTVTIDGQEITYWRHIRMLATSYSANTAGVSPDVPWYGQTYTGDVMRKGIVAVDPSVIPLRTQVYVDGYGYGDALDTGSAILARRIDLGFDDSNLELWNRWVDVYLLWPPPPTYQITWVLPNWPPVPR